MRFARTITYSIEADSPEHAADIWDDDGPELSSATHGPRIDVEWDSDCTPQRPAEPGVSIVICLRDPDYDNAYEIFPGTEPGVEIVDIDLGRSDLSDEDELAEWRESHMLDVNRLRDAGHTAAADYYEGQINEVEAR